MKWCKDHIEVDPPRKPKKMTATRFAAALGLNKWSSPFETWCAITRTYEKPYEDTIYTIAGKTIEPKQIQYMRDAYAMDNLRSPTDIYGEDFFHKTWGDFFHDKPIFGGMWDSLLVDDAEKPTTVLEFKTSKRVEDWATDIPEYYALQAALYAYLLGVDDVIMIASFLTPSDYDHPEKFVPSVSNTITREFKVSQRYPNFQELIDRATDWWNRFVKTGISPFYDEKVDEEILEALRTNHPEATHDLKGMIAMGEALQQKIDTIKAESGLADLESQLKDIKDHIKEFAMTQFREGDTKIKLGGEKMEWTLSKSEGTELDKAALKKDGLLEKYTKTKTNYRLTVANIKEDK